MVLSRIVIAAGLVAFAGPALAQSPSFNCARAGTPVEKLVCAEPRLAWLDRFMDGVYRRAAASMPEAGKKALRGDQRDWIRGRESRCAAGHRAARVECVGNSYRSRIATLAPLVEGGGEDGPAGKFHYFREFLSGQARISKAADGSWAIRGDTVASNPSAHNCGIELDKGELKGNVIHWDSPVTECRTTMTFTGDAATVKYQCAGGSNPDCGVAAAWDGLWVRAPNGGR